MTDVRELATEFIAGYDGDAAVKTIGYARKIEDQFRDADRFIEEHVGSDLVDCTSDDESDFSSEDDDDEYNSS